MTDKLILSGMRFYGRHGVYPEENKLGQLFIVDLVMHLRLDEAGSRDDLARTVNYAEVGELVRRLVEGKPFRLIEALAEHIAQTVLDTYTGINALTVRVTKPNPPVALHFDGVTVELHRGRGESR